MGYFANATEGAEYERDACDDCGFYVGGCCPVLRAHQMYQHTATERTCLDLQDIKDKLEQLISELFDSTDVSDSREAAANVLHVGMLHSAFVILGEVLYLRKKGGK